MRSKPYGITWIFVKTLDFFTDCQSSVESNVFKLYAHANDFLLILTY